MAGNSGTSTRSDKTDGAMFRNGIMSPFVKEEFPVLRFKEETMTTREYSTLKENYESLKKQYEFLMEKLEFERSEKIRQQKEMRELEERSFGLKRDTILLREENLREKSQREEYEKLLEEMKTKEREDTRMISEMKDEIHRCSLELEMWKSRLGELEKMVMDVAKDCLELRSMYENEMNGGVSCDDVGVGRPGNVGTGETTRVLCEPRIESTGQGGNNNKLDGHYNFGDEADDLNKSNTLTEKHGGVIEISDSEEDKNLPGDGQDRSKSKSLEGNQTADGKRLRISPDLNRDSVSSCNTRGGGGRRISSLGFRPRPYSSSSSSTDTSSSDSDA